MLSKTNAADSQNLLEGFEAPMTLYINSRIETGHLGGTQYALCESMFYSRHCVYAEDLSRGGMSKRKGVDLP